jgi:hypothetical protein
MVALTTDMTTAEPACYRRGGVGVGAGGADCGSGHVEEALAGLDIRNAKCRQQGAARPISESSN